MLSKVCVIPSHKYTVFRHFIIADEQYELLSNEISSKSALYTVMMVEYTFWEIALHKNMCLATESSQTSSTGSCRMEFLKSCFTVMNTCIELMFREMSSYELAFPASWVMEFLQKSAQYTLMTVELTFWEMSSDNLAAPFSCASEFSGVMEFLKKSAQYMLMTVELTFWEMSSGNLAAPFWKTSSTRRASSTTHPSPRISPVVIHCDALQHTATHCNALQRTKTHT